MARALEEAITQSLGLKYCVALQFFSADHLFAKDFIMQNSNLKH